MTGTYFGGAGMWRIDSLGSEETIVWGPKLERDHHLLLPFTFGWRSFRRAGSVTSRTKSTVSSETESWWIAQKDVTDYQTWCLFRLRCVSWPPGVLIYASPMAGMFIPRSSQRHGWPAWVQFSRCSGLFEMRSPSRRTESLTEMRYA